MNSAAMASDRLEARRAYSEQVSRRNKASIKKDATIKELKPKAKAEALNNLAHHWDPADSTISDFGARSPNENNRLSGSDSVTQEYRQIDEDYSGLEMRHLLSTMNNAIERSPRQRGSRERHPRRSATPTRRAYSYDSGMPVSHFPPQSLPYSIPPFLQPSSNGEVARDLTGEDLLAAPPDEERSAQYSSRFMQTLSWMEGVSLGQASARSQEQDRSIRKERRELKKRHPSSKGKALRDLHEEGKLWILNKQRWIALEKARKEGLEAAEVERNCSFKPKISRFASRLNRPTLLRPENRTTAELVRRMFWLASRKQEQLQKEMEPCTFHPQTLHAIKSNDKAEQKERRKKHDEKVFGRLFDDAKSRQRFKQEMVVPLVERVNHITGQDAGSVLEMPPEEVEQVVERLFRKGVVTLSAGELAQVEGGTFHPKLSEKTQEIIEQQQKEGKRATQLPEQLYERHLATQKERLQAEAEAEEQEKEKMRRRRLREMERREAKRTSMFQERLRSVLTEKFRLLARSAAKNQGVPYIRSHPVSASGIARAAVLHLSDDQSTEVVAILEQWRQDSVSEEDFVEGVLSAILALEYPDKHPLAIPLPVRTACNSKKSIYKKTSSPQPVTRVKREAPDPEKLAAARRSREQFLKELIEKSERKKLGIDNDECVVVPRFRAGKVPGACLPSTQLTESSVEARKNRAAHLREAFVKQQLELQHEKEMEMLASAKLLGGITSDECKDRGEIKQAVSSEHPLRQPRGNIRSYHESSQMRREKIEEMARMRVSARGFSSAVPTTPMSSRLTEIPRTLRYADANPYLQAKKKLVFSPSTSLLDQSEIPSPVPFRPAEKAHLKPTDVETLDCSFKRTGMEHGMSLSSGRGSNQVMPSKSKMSSMDHPQDKAKLLEVCKQQLLQELRAYSK